MYESYYEGEIKMDTASGWRRGLEGEMGMGIGGIRSGEGAGE